MDIEPQTFFQILKEQSKDAFKGPSECYRLLSILNYNLTEEQLSSSLIELYLLHAFDKSSGLFNFILSVISSNKFDTATIKSLEIVYTLINTFPSKIEQYILDINEKCLKIVRSNGSAKVKAKSLDVLLISFEKIDKCLENQEQYRAVFEGIENSLMLDHSDSVKQKEFMVLGLFMKKFSYLIDNPGRRKMYFVSQLDKEMIVGCSQGNVNGIFTGLGYFCESFPLSVDNPDDAKILEKLHKYIKDLSTPKSSVHYGNRAAITFFGDNIKVFIKLAIKEYRQWHKKLFVDWLAMGAEDRKAGEQTLKAYLLAVSEILLEMRKTEGLPILKHFIGWLKQLIRKQNPSHIEKKLAIQGLKYFCSPLYRLYPKEEAREVFLIVMQNFEKNYILNENYESEEWEFLPDYIQCLASFMRYQSFTTSELYCLQRAVIIMIKTFHKLKPLHHSIVIEALVSTFFYLKKTDHLDIFLENIVYQGVVWSCSHQHITDSELSSEQQVIITVKNYFPLWRGLLKVASNRSYDKYSIYLEDRKYILTKIINELVKTLMILINKLNVNVKLKEDVIQTDIETAYQVEQSSDFSIFLNVTDFYQEIFGNIDPAMFRHCICKMINHLVTKCLKYPLISGFYKLLSFALKIANSLELFVKGNLIADQDVTNCKETLSKFVAVLLHKMKQFKDELLISSLQVLLESPVVVVEPMLQDCVGIFISIFEVGRSYIALANMGLSTLELWQKNIETDEFEKFLEQVIPCLDSYLRSKSLGGIMQTNTAIEKKRKTAQALKKRTVLVELEPELVKFQKRILHFVGSQNSKICQAFVSPDNNFERKVTSDNLHLKVALPYEDLTLEVYLEPFVLRTVELSLYCSDRKTRVMACELLQAFVMVFLGRAKQIPPTRLSDLDELLKNITMPLLQLSCDIDQVVRQIFEPLMMQLIHWYTSKSNKMSPHLAVLITVLMEGVTHPTNSSLRDFSGKCLNEFVSWTIKQHTETALRNDPSNIKVLVKRIRFFSGHPDLVKKLGAALIFNNIYKEIREERALISIFSMELLHIFISSLSLLETLNEEVENTVLQIINAIRHLKRVFVEKSQIFRKNDDLRRVPSDITSGDLNGLSKWLLTATASRSKYCRDIAMEVFIHIQPLSGTGESLSEFVQNNFPNLTSLYEVELAKTPTFEDINVNEGSTSILKWLQSFLCSVDGHIFVIKNSLCSVNLDDKDSLTFAALCYFLKTVHSVKIEQALKLVYKNSTIPYYTAVNKEQFSTLKASCCLAVLKLASVITSDEVLCDKCDDFWNNDLWKFILNVIFNPATMGLDNRSPQPKYLEVLELLLNMFPRKLGKNKLTDFVQVLRSYVSDNFDLDIDLKRNVNQKQRNILKGLLMIHRSQLNNIFKAEDFSKGLIEKLMNNFYNNKDNDAIFIGRLSETTIEHCSLILKFALHTPQEYKSLLSHICKDVTVICQELSDIDSQSIFGVYFLTKFGDVVVRFIVDNFDEFLGGSENIELTLKLSSFLLGYLEKNKQEFGNVLGRISEGMLAKWVLFEMYFEENSIDAGLDFVKHLWRMFGRNLGYGEDIQKWVLSLITRDQIIMSEQEDTSLYLNIFTVLAEIVISDEIENLSVALEKIKFKLEPVISNTEYNTLADKLLATLPTVKCQTIFKFLIEFYVNNAQNVKTDIDLTNLLKSFMLNNSGETHDNILKTIYELSLEEKTFDQKKILTENVLPHVFKNSSYQAFERFFEQNIIKIQDDLKNMTDCGNGIVNFLLVEMLFLRIPIGSEERTYCSISQASGNPKLQAALLKLALDAFKNRSIEENNEHLRLYKCSAYKALASIISNSIKKISLYEKLFVREENGQDILWNALIDVNITYNFPIDFDSYPKKRKILVNIRDELRQQASHNQSKSFRYIASQKLFNSSLSEDVTKFDFTNTVLRTNTGTSKVNGDNEEDEEHTGETKLFQGELYLEATEINNHELMGTICGIIDHIFRTGICQLPENDEDMVEFPPWMEGIRNLLLNADASKNVKIFWVKVIDNMIHIFRHFARYFMEPLLQVLNDKIAGTTINYFVTDVIVILASWTSQIQPNEKEAQLASNLLQHLIENLSNERQDAFKYNMDLIKLFVENWKEFITVPYDNLFAKLNYANNDRKIEVGIHLTSIFLVNGILPCELTNLNSFSNKLVNILATTITTIYKPCAETVGLLLKYFEMNGMEEISFSTDISKVILGFGCINKYAGCLEGVAIHYPDIVDTFHLSKIFNRLPQSDQNLQTTFLKIMLKRADVLNDVLDFRSEDWSKYLESPNAEVQLLTLEILFKTFQDIIQEESFKGVLRSICKNLLNPNVFCRGRMYDIMMAILDFSKLEDQEQNDVTEQCKDVLIQGLVDSDVEIREKIRQYFSESSYIPSGISTKFSFLISTLYLPKAEDHFLGYTSYFLLDSIKSEAYEDELFEHPLEDCDFEEYKLQTNWRLQHPSVVPMFAETLRTYTEGLDDGFSGDFGVLRATQNYLTFAPTQQTVRERHISQLTSLETSLIGMTVGDQRAVNEGFINPNAVYLSERYKLPKRRFLRDKTKIAQSFAHRAVGQKIQKAVKRYEEVKEREKMVTIYRSYRKGDFPDIQITLGSLIKPLQMLVLHDGELSKTLFSVIYKTLFDKVSRDLDFINTISDSIKRIFTNSVQFNVNVFSTLLDILLKSKKTIRMDPGLISTVCQQSGLISVGTLLIEEYLIGLDDMPGSSKRGAASENTETRHWLKLAELYKELHEWNLVRTIFLEKSNCKEEVHKAIKLESEKRWREAQDEYEKILKTDLCAERRDFYFESYFKCLAHLGEWENLPKVVDIVVPDSKGSTWNALWDNDWLQQKLLPCYMGAQLKNMLFSGNTSQQFLLDINSSLGNPEQADYLKNKFSEELCMLWLTQKDTAQATQYLKRSLDNFLNEWQLLNPMFGNLRYNKVLSLRNLIEINRFLSEFTISEDWGEENLKYLQNYWKSTQKEFLPSIILNEAKLLYRRLFIKLLLEKLEKINKPELAKELRKTKIMLDISFMNTAVEEENFYMTKRYFKEYIHMKHPKLTIIYGNYDYLYSALAKEPDLKLEKLFESLGKFRHVVETCKDDSGISALNKFFDISQKVLDVLTKFPDLYGKHENKMAEIFGSDVMVPMDIAFGHLKAEALKIVGQKENRDENFIKEKTKALVKLAYFVQDKQGQEEDFVLFVLRAMQLGSKEARQLFPCILLQDSLADDLKDVFVKETESIPTWMFLGWIPQLLANVESPKVTAIFRIIVRIAKTYPQAIMYSYRLSKENYEDEDNFSDEETIRLIKELDELLLCDPVVDKFLTALSKVNVPPVSMEYYLKKIHSSPSIDKVIKIKDHLMKDLFRESSDSRDATNMQGNMYKYLKDLKNDFQKINSQLPLPKIREMVPKIDEKRKKILSTLATKEGKSKCSLRLQDYSPWLANFSAGRMNLELEIPGQYSGDKLPLVQHHVKISGFCDTVSVMSSLRRPIKVTMLGMDSKEYPFLIKFGEDIRQDQRIQQLFILMNNILASDNKNHRTLTYEVIPLTTSLGIIQWIENTTSLEDFIKKSIKPQQQGIFRTLSAKYEAFVEKAGKELFEQYGNTAINKKRDRVIPFYNSLVNAIPWDVLRTSIWSMSLTTESFIAFRNNFIKSYATICACHWILGIGDRHLQNSKVCTRSGKVLGIDFGHAFGTATQILPIPELVPIRLTPHIVDLMQPLKEKSSFRDVMIDCLKSLRKNRDSLLATMNVFIQEPSVDWLENARRFQVSNEENEQEWYPLQKVEQAKRKLEGASSTAIMIEDLKSSSLIRKRPQFVKAYVSLVEGDPQHNLRARLRDKEVLTVEEQVDSLIDHATDPNLLGRMYSGWSSYV